MFWLILLFVVIAAVTAVGLLGYGGTTLADSGRAGLLRGLAALCGAGTCALYGWGLYGWGLLFVGGAGACALYGWGLLFVGGAGACALYGWGLLFVGGAGTCALYGWGLLFVGGAGACALYGWGLLFVGGAVLTAEDGGTDSSPPQSCRTPGWWERHQRGSEIVDYSVRFVPLGFVCETSDGGSYDNGDVPGYVNPAALGLALAGAGCAVAAGYATEVRARAGARREGGFE